MTPPMEQALRQIGELIDAWQPFQHAPGFVLGLTDRERTLGVLARGYANLEARRPMRPETPGHLGSISKSFAAILCVQEAQAGRMDLHAPVTDYVRWAQIPTLGEPVTLHHLLTHTSGLVTGTEDTPDAPAAVWNLRATAPGFAPGERFWYSNDAYKLVGLALEAVTGRSIRDLLRERLFDPLGMTASEPATTNDSRARMATGYQRLHDDRPPRLDQPLVPAPWFVSTTADGSIVSTAEDMCRYARMLLAGGDGVLSKEGFERLTTPVIGDPDEPGWSYAYGLWVGEREGRPTIWHSGSVIGFNALLWMDRGAGLGLVALVNGEAQRRPIAMYALDAARAALDGAAIPAPPEPENPRRVPDAEAYAGVYEGPLGSVAVQARDGGLLLRRDPDQTMLEREGGDVFAASIPGMDLFSIRFVRDGDQVVELAAGPDRFARRGSHRDVAEPPHPPEWDAFAGHYRSNNSWDPAFRVFVRGGRLWRSAPGPFADDGGEEPLTLLDDGWFRVGNQPWSPHRIRFDREVEGRALRAVYDGASWYRVWLR